MGQVKKIRDSLHVCIGRIEVLKESFERYAKTDPYFEWDDHARNMGHIIERLESVAKELEDFTTKREMIGKACEAFCKVSCCGKPPQETCLSLGTCDDYDRFKKMLEE